MRAGRRPRLIDETTKLNSFETIPYLMRFSIDQSETIEFIRVPKRRRVDLAE